MNATIICEEGEKSKFETRKCLFILCAQWRRSYHRRRWRRRSFIELREQLVSRNVCTLVVDNDDEGVIDFYSCTKTHCISIDCQRITWCIS